MSRPRLFCELPAGLAAVSLQLQGGAHCRPPISRMGNKAGYSKVILGVLGLHSGQGAGAYWWAEADQDVAALLRIYPDPVALLEVARIIRGWSDEEPRALWERLRAERRERGSRSDPEGVAGWMVANAWSFVAGNLSTGFRNPHGGFSGNGSGTDTITINGLQDRAARLAEYAMIAASNRLICVSGPDLMNTGDGGTRFGGEFATAPEAVAEGMERVAEFSFLHQGSFSYRGPDAGIGRPEGMEAHGTHGAVRPVASILSDAFPRLAEYAMSAPGSVAEGMERVAGWMYTTGNAAPHALDVWKTVPASAVACGVQANLSASGLSDRAARLSARGWPPVRVSLGIPTAAEVSAAIGTPGDLEGCIVYSDPPYINTTGYGHDLSRAAVVAMALDFAAMGATVAISEQTPISELDGWESVEISEGRVGQKRTFSKQKNEWITMNRTPAFKIPTQCNLFGVSE